MSTWIPLFQKRPLLHHAIAVLLACGLTHKSALAEAATASSGLAVSCEDQTRALLRFVKPSPDTIAAVCSCTERRLIQRQGLLEIMFDCAAPYAINYMTEYARVELESYLRVRGLDANQRERFAKCFGVEFWRKTKQLADLMYGPEPSDAEALVSICLVTATRQPK